MPYKDANKRQVHRKRQGNDGPAEERVLTGRDRFRLQTFLPMLDKLFQALDSRIAAYKVVSERFGFMTSFQEMTAAMIVRDATALQQHYENDLEENFPEEFEHISIFMKEVNLKDDEGEPVESPSVKMLYKIPIDKKLVSTFSNVEVAMRIYLSLMVSNATGERTFSNSNSLKVKSEHAWSKAG